jgi:signal transduction histidine kinase
MKRPWFVWLLFACCLAVVFAALGWTTAIVERLDRDAARAREQAELEDAVRLSLWRMDSWLTTLVAQENSRPYFCYSAFYSSDRPYANMFNPVQQKDPLVPSPFLVQVTPYVLLHFQFDPSGKLTSPEAPSAEQRRLVQATNCSAERIALAAARLVELQKMGVARQLADRLPAVDTLPTVDLANVILPPRQSENTRQSPLGQQELNRYDYQVRGQSVQMRNNVEVNNDSRQFDNGAPPGVIQDGVMHALWIRDSLILARRIKINGRSYVQGCWLDWPSLKETLLASVQDLLPAAELEPASILPDINQERMLAALPMRLVPGKLSPSLVSGFSAIQLSLVVAWTCTLFAALAVGGLLWGVVTLSERRSAFVSAVTHELRTPLTTFRMYTEMLVQGMVPDAQQRGRYLNTLRIEADRLSHLVENVLAYARLERGSRAGRAETISLDALLGRVTKRLIDRVEQAGLCLAVEPAEQDSRSNVRADISAVEQILFNLVDNACKYGVQRDESGPSAGCGDSSESSAVSADSSEVTLAGHHESPTADIHLESGVRGKFLFLRIRDHGQGILPREARRLFRPFSKSAHQAAHSAPGVGLGLALSRRLAREMGGDLQLETPDAHGAAFVLLLPRG